MKLFPLRVCLRLAWHYGCQSHALFCKQILLPKLNTACRNMSGLHVQVDSAVTAESDDVKSEKGLTEPAPQEVPTYLQKPAPFSMRWIRGYNPRVPVINLNDRGSTILFYAASNCGVLYNWTTNRMRILQGHKHTVTCIATDADGTWLVTADSGPENIVTVWDSTDLFPHRTLFNPHHSTKVSKVILSADAKYLLTLAYSSEKATLHWWIWSYGLSTPHAMISVDMSQNAVVDMAFNPDNSTQFVLMTKLDIWIGISGKIFVMERGLIKETDGYELKIRKPERNIGVEHGKLTCFTFVGNTSQILVGTSRGAMLVYGYALAFQESGDSCGYEELKYVKVVQVEKHRINVVKSVDDVIVTGNSQGEVRFYDEQLKLVYWVEHFRPDCVRSLSFNMSPRSYELLDPKCDKPCPCWEKVVSEVDPMTGVLRQRLITKKLPTDSTRQHKPFIVRDFVISTHNEGIAFVDFANEKLQTIIDCKIHPATALTVHPEKPLVCLGYANGLVEIFNFELHKLFTRISLREYYKVIIPPDEDSINQKTIITRPELIVSCLKYSPSGLHLACGLNTGQLLFLDPVTIAVISQTSDTSHSIKEINYSCDSLTLAMADEGKTVCVYKYDCEKLEWNFIGKHRAHYKDITTVFFTPEKNKDGEYKLLSLGLDRVMVEYDIGTSSEEYLDIMSLDRIEQTAVPLTGIYWPGPEYVDEDHRKDVPMILMAIDEFKYKIVNYNTTMTLATYLGPRYEDAVCKMQLITHRENNVEQQYLLYATKNIIGLQKMPLDGNPWKHTAMMGHPVQITQMCFREDIDTLFTIGYKDTCMIQWVAKYKSVETTTIQGGIDLDPYYCLVEGSRPGWLFQEIRDLFYYIQILCQGTFSPAMRTVKDVIPIESLPDLMRALGYFPSEYEVENLIVEAKFKVNQYTPSAEVDFEEFVKLYLNHRPAHGYNYIKLRNAFRNFATPKSDKSSYSHVIEREDFIDALSNYGESFSREQSWYLLSILEGLSFEDRAALQDNDFSFLPEEINFSEFINSLMGTQEMDISDRSLKSNAELLSMGSLQASSTSSAPSLYK